MLDRRLFTSMSYPADYGFIEGTLGEDGDPLDALCLVGEPTFPGCRIRVRVVGVFHMTDEKGPDEKIICVPLKDPAWMRVHDVHDIPPEFRDEIEHFFQVYKDLEEEKDGDPRLRQPRRGRADHRGGEGAWQRSPTRSWDRLGPRQVGYDVERGLVVSDDRGDGTAPRLRWIRERAELRVAPGDGVSWAAAALDARFSTYAAEALDLAEERKLVVALVYAAGSVVVGMAAVFVGRRLGRAV